LECLGKQNEKSHHPLLLSPFPKIRTAKKLFVPLAPKLQLHQNSCLKQKKNITDSNNYWKEK